MAEEQAGNEVQETEGNTPNNGGNGGNDGNTSEKLFTQEELNMLLKERLDRQKDKFTKNLDDIKSSVDVLTKQLADEKAQKDKLLKEREHKDLVESVAKEKKLPANLLHGNTKEELEASAKELTDFISKSSNYPIVADPGEGETKKHEIYEIPAVF